MYDEKLDQLFLITNNDSISLFSFNYESKKIFESINYTIDMKFQIFLRIPNSTNYFLINI
jgi:hypothetical protein